MDYQAVRLLHIACAVLSIAGFTARGVLMLRGSPMLGARFVRVAPHLVDTVLLASAGWLAWASHQYPFVQGWLTAKVLALLLYIVLGTIALKRGRNKATRTTAFALALLAVLYIVSVAITRNPGGFVAFTWN